MTSEGLSSHEITIVDDKITEIEVIGDPARLGELDVFTVD